MTSTVLRRVAARGVPMARRRCARTRCLGSRAPFLLCLWGITERRDGPKFKLQGRRRRLTEMTQPVRRSQAIHPRTPLRPRLPSPLPDHGSRWRGRAEATARTVGTCYVKRADARLRDLQPQNSDEPPAALTRRPRTPRDPRTRGGRRPGMPQHRLGGACQRCARSDPGQLALQVPRPRPAATLQVLAALYPIRRTARAPSAVEGARTVRACGASDSALWARLEGAAANVECARAHFSSGSPARVLVMPFSCLNSASLGAPSRARTPLLSAHASRHHPASPGHTALPSSLAPHRPLTLRRARFFAVPAPIGTRPRARCPPTGGREGSPAIQLPRSGNPRPTPPHSI